MSEEINTEIAVTGGVTEPNPVESTNNNVNDKTEDKTQQQQVAQQNKKAAKKTTEVRNDSDKFSGAGVVFNAKLIGIADVPDARGDKMCQDTITKLKIAVKTAGVHKQKIIVNVSEDGIKLIDLRTATIIHHHPVHKISFISRDVTDRRAFGYIYGAEDRTHNFIGIKTEKAAENLVLTLRDLFQIVYEKKKKQMESAKEQQVEEAKKQEEEESKVVKLGDDLNTESSTDDEPVYQVPMNGSPIDDSPDSPEHIYEVPKNNNPVEEPKKEESILELQNELVTIEQGIEQMNKMESLFDDLPATSTAAAPASDPWGLPAADTSPQTSNGTSASSDLQELNLFSSEPVAPKKKEDILSLFGPPPGQQPGFGAPQPQPGAFGAFPAQPGQPATPFPVGQPGFAGQPAMANPFARPPMAAGFAAPPPVPQRQPPVGTFPPASNPFGAGQPAPFGGTNMFETQPVQQPATSLFDEPVLAPVKIENQFSSQLPPAAERPKDAFADLCDLGTKDKVSKTPKDLFADINTQPKKSMNEMIVEKTSGPQQMQPQASDPFGSVDNDALPDAVNFSLSFPCKSSDPFDTSFLHPPQTKSALAAKSDTANFSHKLHTDNNTSVTENSTINQNVINSSDGDDLFDLPSPDGPPPPLPSGLPPPLPTDHMPFGVDSSPVPPVPPPRPNSASSGSTNSPSLPPRNVDHVTSASDRHSPMHGQSTDPQNSLPTTQIPRPRPRANVNNGPPKLPPRNTTHSENSSVTKSQVNIETVTENSVVNIKSDVNDIGSKGFTIEDPFLSSDPFADIDPFSSNDAFSVSSAFDSSDPFMSFSSQKSEQSNVPSDSKQNGESLCNSTDDPFAVFDNSFGDSFNFKSGSLKKSGKRKSSGSKHTSVNDPSDPFGVLLASKPVQQEPLYGTVNKGPM